ncbi:MAG: hypothetical protein HY059_14970 [Proteobacteria bacterium]|nr:hypothetical protein [Pseudomonadota bacterium]
MARTVNPADEARRFLDALDEKAEGIAEVLAHTKEDVARSSYSAYKRFADAVSDFDSFCILIEYRIKKVEPGEERTTLDARFHSARVGQMARQLKTSIELMALVASAKELPLGAKELFLRELRAIYTLKNALSGPPYSTGLQGDTVHDVELAEKILHEIIERAPALLDLSISLDKEDDEGESEGGTAPAAGAN